MSVGDEVLLVIGEWVAKAESDTELLRLVALDLGAARME